jgi:hypothetical protein
MHSPLSRRFLDVKHPGLEGFGIIQVFAIGSLQQLIDTSERRQASCS